jgi:hypothetical protein
MRGRVVAAAGALAAAVPVIAWADALPPHSSFYAEHHNYMGKGTNIEFRVQRAKHTSDIYASYDCLGKTNGYTNQATVRGAQIHKQALHYNGHATVYEATGSKTVTVKLSATVTSKKVTGTVAFPNTKGCSKRGFTATLVSSTK